MQVLVKIAFNFFLCVALCHLFVTPPEGMPLAKGS